MASKTREPKTPEITPTEEPPKPADSDYFEIRLPKLRRSSLLFYLLSLAAAFLLGMVVMKYVPLMLKAGSVTASDAPGMFVAFAKELNLDQNKFQSCLDKATYTNKITEDMDTGNKAGVNATPTFFVNGQPIVGAQPYSVFQAIIDQQLNGSTTLPLPTPEATDPQPQTNISTGHLPLLGNKDAKVTVVEFSDFQCPFCEQFFTSTLPSLKKDYIDTGKVRLAYRQFPLTSIHPNAHEAAEAAECANEQGKFWEYHDLLFGKQDSWVNLPLAITPSP